MEGKVPLLSKQVEEARAAVRNLDVTDREELQKAKDTAVHQRTLRYSRVVLNLRTHGRIVAITTAAEEELVHFGRAWGQTLAFT